MSIVFQDHVCMPIVVLKCKALFQQVLIQLAYGFADFLLKNNNNKNRHTNPKCIVTWFDGSSSYFGERKRRGKNTRALRKVSNFPSRPSSPARALVFCPLSGFVEILEIIVPLQSHLDYRWKR